MRLLMLFLITGLVAAGAAEPQAPRSAPPKGLLFKAPQVPWWNSAEKARVAFQSPTSPLESSLIKPRVDLLLLAYPYQAPAQARAFFFFQ